MSKVAVFQSYHTKAPMFKSEWCIPIQLTRDGTSRLCDLQDNGGDSIADRNVWYSELSGIYWVWKNWLPMHPECEYVGFCHYRRGLDPLNAAETNKLYCPKSLSDIQTVLSATDEAVYKAIEDFDIILPEHVSGFSYETQMGRDGEKRREADFCCNYIDSQFPEYKNALVKARTTMPYMACCFIMRKALFVEYATWIFSIMFALESQTLSVWKSFICYQDIRMPAYINEWLINVWYQKQRDQGARIKEVGSWLYLSSAGRRSRFLMTAAKNLVPSFVICWLNRKAANSRLLKALKGFFYKTV